MVRVGMRAKKREASYLRRSVLCAWILRIWLSMSASAPGGRRSRPLCEDPRPVREDQSPLGGLVHSRTLTRAARHALVRVVEDLAETVLFLNLEHFLAVVL